MFFNFLKSIFTLLFAMLICVSHSLYSQTPVLIHSHNDYLQVVPFYQAYSQGLDIYEADVFYNEKNDNLLVAHTSAEIIPENTLDELYIRPIVKLFSQNSAKAWKESTKKMMLMIDIKYDHKRTIPALLRSIGQYPDVFDRKINPNAVQVVLTGEIPAPSDFEDYSPILFFDGRPNVNYTDKQRERIAFISDSFAKYSVWNGKGSIIPSEKLQLEALIQRVHLRGKKIRFWGCPDNLNTWQTFRMMGVDIINTDKPEKCAAFFRNEQLQNFAFGKKNTAINNSIVRPDKLDKATKSFAGFDDHNLSLDSALSIYIPTGKNDGKNISPKNIILLIGDGMGLSQISAADLVNKGLSFTHLKYIGFQRTQAKGNFITDSAGAGSGIATGVQTPNRAIATDGNGSINTSLTEVFLAAGKACGIVTNGNISDATPAAFYGHTDERDNTDEITAWLTKTQPDFLAGSGRTVFDNRKDGRNMMQELQPTYQFLYSVKEPCSANKKVILLDEQLGNATNQQNLDLLAQTAKKAIVHLKPNKKGFFLMVEGAKIDYAGHANSFPGSIIETLGFELAVQEALKFADQNGETLVIVTGDHETGGLSLIDGNVEEGRISGVYSSDDHTPVFLPIFAYGPGAATFKGVYENTDICNKILNLTAYKFLLK